MLHLLDDALEAYLRAEVPLPQTEIDIVFDRPNRDWGAAVTRPTVNVFLWDIRRNANDQEAGMELVMEEGRLVRRPPKPRIDCRYLITAWAGDVRDEHQLLGTVLGAFLVHSELPAQYLGGGYSEVRPLPTIHVERQDGTDATDFWTAVQGDLRPSLDVVVTATIDAGFALAAGPQTGRFIIGTQRTDDPNSRSERVTVRPDAE